MQILKLKGTPSKKVKIYENMLQIEKLSRYAATRSTQVRKMDRTSASALYNISIEINRGNHSELASFLAKSTLLCSERQLRRDPRQEKAADRCSQ